MENMQEDFQKRIERNEKHDGSVVSQTEKGYQSSEWLEYTTSLTGWFKTNLHLDVFHWNFRTQTNEKISDAIKDEPSITIKGMKIRVTEAVPQLYGDKKHSIMKTLYGRWKANVKIEFWTQPNYNSGVVLKKRFKFPLKHTVRVKHSDFHSEKNQ